MKKRYSLFVSAVTVMALAGTLMIGCVTEEKTDRSDLGEEFGSVDDEYNSGGDSGSGNYGSEDTGSDTGDKGTDTGDTTEEPGDTGTDTGDTVEEPGDTGTDTGETGEEPGDTGTDTGDTGEEPGDTGTDTGDTGEEPGDTGSDTGDTGSDTGDTGEDIPPVGEDYRLVINEIDYDNYGTEPEKKQFIEIYNAGTSTADLSKIKLYFTAIDSVENKQVFQLVSLHESSSVSATDNMKGVLAPGEYLLIHKGWNKEWDKYTLEQKDNLNCQTRKVFINIDKPKDGRVGAVALVKVDGTKGTLLDAVSYGGCMTSARLPFGSFTTDNYLDGTFNLCEKGSIGTDLDQNVLSIARVKDGQDTDNGPVDFKLSKPSTPCAPNEVVPTAANVVGNSDFQDVSLKAFEPNVKPIYHFKNWITSSYVEASNGGDYPYSESSHLRIKYQGDYFRWVLRNYIVCGSTPPLALKFDLKGNGGFLFELKGENGKRFYEMDTIYKKFEYIENGTQTDNADSYHYFYDQNWTEYTVNFGNLSGFCKEGDVLTFSLWYEKSSILDAEFDNFKVVH